MDAITSAARAVMNPFSIAHNPRRVPPGGYGPGRQVVFPVDSSTSYSEAAVRFGLENVVRSNDGRVVVVVVPGSASPPDEFVRDE